MMDNVNNLKGLEIYTPQGIFVGIVDEVIMNIPEMCVDGLFVKDVNPALADKNVCISIPYRWVTSVGDVILLNAFPEERIIAND